MKILRKVSVSGLSVALASMLLLGTSAFAKGEKYSLESIKLSSPISLEANNPAWDKVPALNVVLGETPYEPDGYPGITKTKVVLKSLHDDKNIYLYMQYDDPTKSTARFPWVKQEDGSWKQSGTKDQTGNVNDYYEDKVAVLWDINARGFAKKGCAIACHITKEGKNNGFSDNSAGRKYTRKAGETIDMWHWKSVRTGLAFDLSHDQYIDSIADPEKNKNWGRHGDVKNSGGYKNNKSKESKLPIYMSGSDKNMPYIINSDKVPFVDTFKAGDEIAGIIVEKMTGSAADVMTSNLYANGKWTLVFKRALLTTGPKDNIQDVQFSDLKKPYYLGVSVFDNSQINHVFHEGSIKLTFK